MLGKPEHSGTRPREREQHGSYRTTFKGRLDHDRRSINKRTPAGSLHDVDDERIAVSQLDVVACAFPRLCRFKDAADEAGR